MDKEKYDIIPVYMSKNNEMYVGDDINNINCYKDIENLLKKSTKVVLFRNKENLSILK